MALMIRKRSGLFNLRRCRRVNLRRCLRGASAVEFALVAPIFLILVFGTIELSRAMWIKATMQYAAEETTRYAIVNTSASSSTLQTYATNVVATYGVDTTDMTITASISSTTVLVTITMTFTALVPMLSLPDISLSAKSQIPLATS